MCGWAVVVLLVIPGEGNTENAKYWSKKKFLLLLQIRELGFVPQYWPVISQ